MVVAAEAAAGGTLPQQQLHQGLRRSLHLEHHPSEEEVAAVGEVVVAAVRSAECGPLLLMDLRSKDQWIGRAALMEIQPAPRVEIEETWPNPPQPKWRPSRCRTERVSVSTWKPPPVVSAYGVSDDVCGETAELAPNPSQAVFPPLQEERQRILCGQRSVVQPLHRQFVHAQGVTGPEATTRPDETRTRRPQLLQ